jgi:hypothetical protein
VVKRVSLDPRMVYWAQAVAAASDVEDFILRTRQGERERITRRAVVEDATLTQVKIQGAWYAKHILAGIDGVAVGQEYEPMRIVASRVRASADYEVPSDLFLESGANLTDRLKVLSFEEAMREEGVAQGFPPIYGRLRVIEEGDLSGDRLCSSRPLAEGDVGRLVVIIENGHHRAYACMALGLPLRVVDGDLAEMSDASLASIFNASLALLPKGDAFGAFPRPRGG